MQRFQFQYRAILPDGEPLVGVIAAADITAATALLTARGLKSIEIAPVESSTAATSKSAVTAVALSAAELTQLAEHLEMLTRSGLPLAPGLRAMAKEHPRQRLSAALLEVAGQLEAGHTLDEALAGQPRLKDGNLGRLIEAGVRTGTLAQILSELVDIERASRELGRTIRLAISYPLLILASVVVLAILVSLFLLPGFQEATGFQAIHLGWQLDLSDRVSRIPLSTRIVMWFSGPRLAIALACVAGGTALLALLIRLVCQPATYWRWIEKTPFVGPMVLWRNVATWARLMGLFLEHGIPAPAALQMAASGVRDANVAEKSRALATFTSAGHGLAASVAADARLPASLWPLLRWGEDAGALPAALRTAGDMFENRVRIRAGLLRIVLPPLVFVLVAFGTLAIWNILLAPLIQSINALSGVTGW